MNASPVKIWRNQKKLTKLIGLCGSIVSWTFVRVPPAGFVSQAPYPVVLVKLESRKTIIAQLVDWEEPHLAAGQKVITIIRKVRDAQSEDVIPYGIKVKPVISS